MIDGFLTPRYIPLEFSEMKIEDQTSRAKDFFGLLVRRRTVRDYSSRPVPISLIETAIATAGTAPSGANLQPWRFVVVRDPEVKKKIREAAEKEEYESYHGRMSEKWLRRLAPLGTNEHKPFLEIALGVSIHLIALKTYHPQTEPAGTQSDPNSA